MNMKMKKTLAICAGVVVILGGVKYCQISAEIAKHASFRPPPESVTSIKAIADNWQDSIEAVGSLAAVQGAMLSAEEPGRVVAIGFESGSMVSAGDMIVRLDTAVEEGQLKAAEARVELAQVGLRRSKNLRAEDLNAKSDLDKAEAEFKQAQGDAEAVRGVIQRKTIVAPFAGRLGIRMVNLGQYLTQGASVIALNQLDPIYVNFSVPERFLPELAVGQAVELSVDSQQNVAFSGTVNAIDSQVDELTRNLKVQATIQNKEMKLTPGMFGKVRVLLPHQEKVIALPTSSISYAPYGDSVYVIEKMKGPDGAEYQGVRQQFVKLGQKRGDRVAILSGIKEGEEIATSGVFKLRPSAGVVVNNEVTPDNSLSPKPVDS